MEVIILMFQDCMALPAIGTFELLRSAAALHVEQGRADAAPPFSVRLVACGLTDEVRAMDGLRVCCDTTLAQATPADLIIVPSLDGDVLALLEQNRAVIGWLQEQYARGADVASICTGAFLLAEAGLLDGRAATTHWAAEERFRARYPQIELRPQQILVDQGRVCTCGGATSFLNLGIYLVEKYLGQQTAQLTARRFLIDRERSSQGTYAIFSVQKSHGDDAVLQAQSLIEEKLDQPITVERLAHTVAVSRRNFVRRFKRATGNTPLEYIQRARVEAAKQVLAFSRRTLIEVACEVGYQDLAAFRRIFTRETGVSPGEYRRRHAQRASTTHRR